MHPPRSHFIFFAKRWLRAKHGLALVLVMLASSVACSRRAAPSSAAVNPVPTGAAAVAPAQALPQPAPVPSGPPVKLFAKKYVVKLRLAPSKEALRIGYLRGGAVVQAKTAQPIGFDKCRKGWYELVTGGFLCSTVDAIAFLGKRLPERQPLQPDLAAPLPYPYGYSRKRNTPMYRRLPTDEEAARYEGGKLPAVPTPAAAQGADPASAPSPEAPGVELAANAPAPQISGAPGSGEEGEVPDGGVATLESLRGEAGSVLMRRMERGFYVSLDREMEKGTRSYYRTQSNGFIPNRGLLLVDGSDFHGVELNEQTALPIAFVMSSKSFAFGLDARGKLRRGRPPGYHFMFPVASESVLHGTTYLVDANGQHYRAQDVTRLAPRARPAEVQADEKWIDVDLAAQSLIAYVGDRPVYATLISSGRIKDELDPLKNFVTPTGSFRISSKHLTATMDGDHAIDGPYSIEDVPYVMYFQLAYALHSAFWHNGFGRPRSHGCINLAPLDASWIFNFAEPALPVPWHGVYPREGLPGTRLYIHGETPQG